MRPRDPANSTRRPERRRSSATRNERGALLGETVASLILEHAHDAVFATDLDNRITFWGASAEALFGYPADEAMGRPFGELLPFMIGGEQPEAELLSAVADGRTWRGEGSVRLRDGRALWIESTVRPLVVDGQIVGGVSVSRDMTAQRAEADRYRTVVDALAEGVVVQDADGAIVMANPAARAILGWGRRRASTGLRWPAEALREDGTLLAVEDHPAAATLRTGRARRNAMVGLRRPSGEVRWIAVHTDPLPTPDGRHGVVSSFEDVTHYRAARTEQLFEGRLRAALADAVHEIPMGVSLERAAQAICDEIATLPGIDLVSLGAFLDGDELVILASHVPAGVPSVSGQRLPADGARYLRERAGRGPWAEYTRELDGVGTWNADLVGLDVEAVAAGPIAHGGDLDGVLVIGTRDREFARTLVEKMPAVVAFSATSSALLAERLHARRQEEELRRTFRTTLDAGAFHPVFQPIVDLETRETVGYEALTRFDSEQRPDLCFADAWSVGFGAELELATLEAAVAAGKRLPPGLWLDLNVSPRLLADAERLRAILWSAERPLVLEVTEHELIGDYERVRGAIRELGRDIRLAVDDAGAGVANFGHIIDLHPDFVKLDISLVRRVNANLGRQAMVVGMRHFSRTAGCRLIAEGIETEEEARTLAELGVAFGQGYLFGHPEPVEPDGAG